MNDDHHKQQHADSEAGSVAKLQRHKPPMQERSQLRVAQALETAEKLLQKLGPEETSIPEIALASGIPRASLYQFFPNKYVLFSHLAEIHLQRVSDVVAQAAPLCQPLNWMEAVPILINRAADYYDQTPVASMLILGGPFSRSAYLAQEVTISNIGQGVRQLMASLDTPVYFPEDPDTTTLATEAAFSCMKYGYYRDNRVTETVRQEAAKMAIAYMAASLRD